MTEWHDPDAIRFMLDDCETWAVVGLSGNPSRTAYEIARLLQQRGKRIVPIHPDAPVVLGEQGYATLADVPFPIDVVDVFRRSEFAGEFADQAVAVGAGAVWFQLGRARRRGIRAHPCGRRTDGDGHVPGDRVAPTRGMNTPGSDLEVPSGPGIPDGVVIPAAELVERFSRSSGPGGQSVNTTDSRVELEYDVASSSALTDSQRARALGNLGPRLVDGRIVVDASEHRSQHRNRVAARERLADLLRTALAPPPPKRRPTKPSKGARQRRIDAKKQRGQTKALRGRVRGEG